MTTLSLATFRLENSKPFFHYAKDFFFSIAGSFVWYTLRDNLQPLYRIQEDLFI